MRFPTRANILPVAGRVAVREYVPLAAFILIWLMIGVSTGHADVVRLVAANAFTQAARALCTVELVPALAARRASSPAIWRQSAINAVRIDLIAMAVAALLLAALAIFLGMRGMPKAGAMVAIMVLALPARNPGALLVCRRQRGTAWKLGAATTGLCGAAIVLVLHLPWQAAALVIASRDWGGLAAAALFAPPRRDKKGIVQTPLTFEEAASRTEASARRRLGYRLMRTLLGVLGPVGNFAARAARSAGGIDRKIAGLIPHSRPGFILFTGATGVSAAILLIASREPSTLVGAAAMASMAASGGAALLWWNYRTAPGEDEDEDDDD